MGMSWVAMQLGEHPRQGMQTESGPRNIEKFGRGQAQFVGIPPEIGLPTEYPVKQFSLRSSVVLAPSSRF
jgi:hypothetical protein